MKRPFFVVLASGLLGAGSNLPAPLLAWITGAGDDTPTLTINVPIGAMVENDTWIIEFYSDASLTTFIDSVSDTVNATDAGDGEIEGTMTTPLPQGTIYARARVIGKTAWSNVASQTLVGDDDDYAAWMAAA